MATTIREVAPGWVEGSAPGQRVFDGKVFPKVLFPAAYSASANAPVAAAHADHEYDQDHKDKRNSEEEGGEDEEEGMRTMMESLVGRNKAFLEEQLYEHGAVLLRGLRCMRSARDFDALLGCLAWEEVAYVGTAPRQRVVGRVITANDSNAQLPIPFHHEMTEIRSHKFVSNEEVKSLVVVEVGEKMARIARVEARWIDKILRSYKMKWWTTYDPHDVASPW